MRGERLIGMALAIERAALCRARSSDKRRVLVCALRRPMDSHRVNCALCSMEKKSASRFLSRRAIRDIIGMHFPIEWRILLLCSARFDTGHHHRRRRSIMHNHFRAPADTLAYSLRADAHAHLRANDHWSVSERWSASATPPGCRVYCWHVSSSAARNRASRLMHRLTAARARRLLWCA